MKIDFEATRHKLKIFSGLECKKDPEIIDHFRDLHTLKLSQEFWDIHIKATIAAFIALWESCCGSGIAKHSTMFKNMYNALN
jgi:hypothetical protein